MATNTPSLVVSISDDPTLVFAGAPTEPVRRAEAFDDSLFDDIVAPVPTIYMCSDNGAAVLSTCSAELRLECSDCGARWGDFDDGFLRSADTGSLHGIRATGWNPEKAPERITSYLQSYAGQRAA